MSARIIDLAEARARRSIPASEVNLLDENPDIRERFHFWCGATGQRYVHTIYSLIECPALPPCNYVLVRADANGRRAALSIGHVAQSAPSLNLAEIRRRGAELGANEVHIHLLAGSPKQSKLVEFDIKTGQVHAAKSVSHACH